ncbi:uncharacterized protein L969DRAFT_94151 [Mixia osmundae IAM 14324]|uniref:Exportin-T n=1 Tax=Mixia osmundae (strain CBS 9802 / IAM 14324 / JCM 22182 / KY 12970) TaxID=764103 RepID=G7DVF7_MIXOS|nr:uncharacterized protein L969DRAFT_94151 [Mixia osmundae IAM 14324]KEI40345.1 hypothetical protein L969DRAFT_94151 [Mixia osmundae IAM 14324]GAA94567.1 hypothetical protein E5Q_01219 [Mixia osmundae IAM 14324]
MAYQSQIASAVRAALDPASPAQQQEAYAFLEQVKSAPAQTWESCFALFSATSQDGRSYAYESQARMFGLQVLDEALLNHDSAFTHENVQSIREIMLDYVHREHLRGQGEPGAPYLRNKSIQTLFVLFYTLYPTVWPNFFDEFLSFMRLPREQEGAPVASTSANAGAQLNYQGTEYVLRLLKEISSDLSDAHLRLNKPQSRLARDAQLREAVRAQDAPSILSALFTLLEELITLSSANQANGYTNGHHHIDSDKADHLLRLCLAVIAEYVTWVDINLVIRPETTPLLYRCLESDRTLTRIQAVDCLVETVSKGMPASDKLKLLQVLQLGDLLIKLHSDLQQKRDASSGQLDEDDEALLERLAKLLNCVGAELCKVLEDNTAELSEKSAAYALASQLLPLVLLFLDNPSDPVGIHLLPFTTSMLSAYKREKKQQNSMTETKAGFLSTLATIAIKKIMYPDDIEWQVIQETLDSDEDDDFIAFSEKRKGYKLILEAIGAIDMDIYNSVARSAIDTTLDALDSKPDQISWQQLELALHLIWIHGEGTKAPVGGPAAYVQMPPIPKAKLKAEVDKMNLSELPLSTLGEMLTRLLRSNVTAFPHESAPLTVFEIVTRYHAYFAVNPGAMSNILSAFLGPRGVFQVQQKHKARAQYLLKSFIHSMRTILPRCATADDIQRMLEALRPLLRIDASVETSTSGTTDVLLQAAQVKGPFDAQREVFETAGILLTIIPDQPGDLLGGVLGDLVQTMKQNVPRTVAGVEDLNKILRIHHALLAVGHVVKPFPQLATPKTKPLPNTIPAFVSTSAEILELLKTTSGIAVIRAAAISTFKNLVAAAGQATMPQVSTFTTRVIEQISYAEMTEFMGFISQLSHQFKDSFVEELDKLCPIIFARTYGFLEQPVLGTDDEVAHSELLRAYFNLIVSILNAGFAYILLSESNQPHLQTMFNAIMHYTSTSTNVTDQKASLTLLCKFIAVWVEPQTPAVPINGNKDGSADATKLSPIPPGFSQFVYERVVPLCFELPRRSTLDFGDAMSYQLIGETAGILKTLQQKRGAEFETFLRDSLLPSAGIAKEASTKLVQSLVSAADGKGFKKEFVEFLRTLRSPA